MLPLNATLLGRQFILQADSDKSLGRRAYFTVGFIDWLGKFNFSKQDDRFFVANLALKYRPSILFINWSGHSEAVDEKAFDMCSCSDGSGFLKDHRSNPSTAKVWLDVNSRDPRRILGAMNAVVFNNAATSNWFALGQCDHAVRHSIQFRMGAEPVENNLGRVASLAPPLFVDPAPNRLEVLWAFR